LYQSSNVSVADKAFFETGIDLVDTIVFNFGRAQGLIEKHLRPDGTKATPEMLVIIRSANILKFPLYNSDIVTPTTTDNVQNMYCSWTQVSLPSDGSPYYFNVIPATSPKSFIDSRTEQLLGVYYIPFFAPFSPNQSHEIRLTCYPLYSTETTTEDNLQLSAELQIGSTPFTIPVSIPLDDTITPYPTLQGGTISLGEIPGLRMLGFNEIYLPNPRLGETYQYGHD
jgi:hypothetical protein